MLHCYILSHLCGYFEGRAFSKEACLVLAAFTVHGYFPGGVGHDPNLKLPMLDARRERNCQKWTKTSIVIKTCAGMLPHSHLNLFLLTRTAIDYVPWRARCTIKHWLINQQHNQFNLDISLLALTFSIYSNRVISLVMTMDGFFHKKVVCIITDIQLADY